MMQKSSFGEIVNQLFYNINIKGAPAESLIEKLKKVAHKYHKSGSTSSLTTSLELGVDYQTKKASHIFTFFDSPIPNLQVNTGYITLIVGEVNNTKRLIDVDWCFQFIEEKDAKIFFTKVKSLFEPLSIKQRDIKSKVCIEEYSEFSASKVKEDEITDLTLFLGKSSVTNNFDVCLKLYNNF